MKWAKVSTAKIAAYKRTVDVFFDHPSFADVHFHSLVIDTHRLDHKTFNDGKREIGFNKEIYQAAVKCARLYPGVFHLYPDQRETDQRPSKLREILNWGRAKQGDRRDFPFRRCQFRDSKKVPHLQLVDTLLGAVAYHINGHAIAEEASPARLELSRHILARARVADVMRDTTRAGKFTIWHRILKKGVPRA